MDEYLKKHREQLKKAKTSKDVDAVLNKVYEDGFEDGANEGDQ
ncbi:MAG: hypothetical protein ACP5N2_03720 [Candidatus Nanoarchaeia archaeon]